jgi:alpha-tubulin suppressor-like RCC1 family protein
MRALVATTPSFKTVRHKLSHFRSRAVSYILVLDSGRIYSFGSNDYGQLDVGSKQAFDTPQLVRLAEGTQVTAISCGGDHNLLLTTEDKVFSFGWGERGQLGKNATADQLVPAPILHPANFTVAAISAGAYGHSMILSKEGEVATFGWCEDGQCGHLGLKEDILIPHKVSTLRNISAICGGYKHTVVIRSDSKLLAFGDQFFGQLGPIRSAVATDVGSLDDNVSDIDDSAVEGSSKSQEEPIVMVADQSENDGERLVM